jgi:hypothetical protein
VVFAIDAQFLETSAASSQRIYAQIQRMRQGGGLIPGRGLGATKARRVRRGLAMLPWWGGVGPVLWRQIATALREPTRLMILAVLLMLPGLIPIAGRAGPGEVEMGKVAAIAFLGVSLYASALFSAIVAFDFRGDVDRMEELKALPLHSLPLAIGQLATPVLAFTLPGTLAFAVASPYLGGASARDFALVAFIGPMAALMIGIDNLLFLLFPTRNIQATAADFTTMGRQVLLLLAKALLGGVTALFTVLMGWLVHSLTGGSWLAAYLAALCVPTIAAASLVPLIALAFRRYDVAADTPA